MRRKSISSVNKSSNFLYKVVSFIPEGKITTYKILSDLTNIKNPRLIGNILHKNPDSKSTPCHRVVNYEGKVAENYAFGGKETQIVRLKEEGVVLNNGKVNLGDHLWKPSLLLFLYFKIFSLLIKIKQVEK